jgi:SAM-dependent methyltransferase
MQHIDHLERAMAELSRVMKPGGVLVIGDRDRLSIIGLLKPFMETTGLWMYPWDSPFQEQWRSVAEWKRIFGGDWLVTFAQSFDNPDNRIPMSNRFYLLAA